MVSKLTKAQVKLLRDDARKLSVIAKHLRNQANELLSYEKASERAEKARLNFYSKQSNIDKNLTLTPESVDELFNDVKETKENEKING